MRWSVEFVPKRKTYVQDGSQFQYLDYYYYTTIHYYNIIVIGSKKKTFRPNFPADGIYIITSTSLEPRLHRLRSDSLQTPADGDYILHRATVQVLFFLHRE